MVNIFCTRDTLDLSKCLFSGQGFGWREHNGSYIGFIKRKPVIATQYDNVIVFDGDISETEIRHYFDLDLDYSKMFDLDTLTPRELSWYSKSKGIRITRNDLLETLVTGIISQRQTMTRTQYNIETICHDYGKQHIISDSEIYSFPVASAFKYIPTSYWSEIGLGFRAKYLKALCQVLQQEPMLLPNLIISDYWTAYNTLKSLYGVGDKVADCVCLFALHHLEAFPIDTHLSQVLSQTGISSTKYGKYAGVMHQYIYYCKAITGNW